MADTEIDKLGDESTDGPPTIIPQYDVDLVPILRDLGDKLFEEVWFMPIDKRIEGKNICMVGTLNKKFRILADAEKELIYLMKPTDSKVPFAVIRIQWDEDRISDHTLWVVVAVLNQKKYTKKIPDLFKYVYIRKRNNYYE